MKIICVGHNYEAHNQELNFSEKSPVLFIKPDTALLRDNNPFYIPDFSNDIHYEVELVVRITRLVKNISERFANRCYQEIGLGVDFTARDLQNNFKAKGLPWEICKGFDYSAPISHQFISKEEFENLKNIRFYLKKNGIVVQKGNSAEMIYSFDRIIAEASKYFTLKIGDLIFTGTPVGVGSVAPGDHLQGWIEDRLMFDFFVK